jgi:hypothetical protein
MGHRGTRHPITGGIDVNPPHLGLVALRPKTYRAREPPGCRHRQRLHTKVGHIATAAEGGSLERMRQGTVEPEPQVLRVGVGTLTRRRRVDIDQHVVAVETQIRHRYVPTQKRQRFADRGGLRGVGVDSGVVA